MNDFFYPHICTLKRFSGSYDSEGLEDLETLYEGECDLQFPSSGGTSLQGGILQAYPALMIPIINLLIKLDDRVEITMENNRVLKGVIKQYNVVTDMDELSGTTIWLDSITDEYTE